MDAFETICPETLLRSWSGYLIQMTLYLTDIGMFGGNVKQTVGYGLVYYIGITIVTFMISYITKSVYSKYSPIA